MGGDWELPVCHGCANYGRATGWAAPGSGLLRRRVGGRHSQIDCRANRARRRHTPRQAMFSDFGYSNLLVKITL